LFNNSKTTDSKKDTLCRRKSISSVFESEDEGRGRGRTGDGKEEEENGRGDEESRLIEERRLEETEIIFSACLCLLFRGHL
jgi:hypothetical protein